MCAEFYPMLGPLRQWHYTLYPHLQPPPFTTAHLVPSRYAASRAEPLAARGAGGGLVGRQVVGQLQGARAGLVRTVHHLAGVQSRLRLKETVSLGSNHDKGNKGEKVGARMQN